MNSGHRIIIMLCRINALSASVNTRSRYAILPAQKKLWLATVNTGKVKNTYLPKKNTLKPCRAGCKMSAANNILSCHLKNNYITGKHSHWNSRNILSIIFDDVNFSEENFKKLESDLNRKHRVTIEHQRYNSRDVFEKNS